MKAPRARRRVHRAARWRRLRAAGGARRRRVGDRGRRPASAGRPHRSRRRRPRDRAVNLPLMVSPTGLAADSTNGVWFSAAGTLGGHVNAAGEMTFLPYSHSPTGRRLRRSRSRRTGGRGTPRGPAACCASMPRGRSSTAARRSPRASWRSTRPGRCGWRARRAWRARAPRPTGATTDRRPHASVSTGGCGAVCGSPSTRPQWSRRR